MGRLPSRFNHDKLIPMQYPFQRTVVMVWRETVPNIRSFFGKRQPLLWLAGLITGIAVGVGAILFRLGIGLFQLPWLRTASEGVAGAAAALHWPVVLFAPAVGGLLVGLLLHRFVRAARPLAIPDVIEARALGLEKIDVKEGLWSALISALSLGTGASAGREGPVVNLGGTLAVATARLLRFDGAAGRTLLACGAASAVSASFNAPVAGVLFAHEVILGHYALSAFVPVVIASVAGGILSRLWFGEAVAFVIPDYHVATYLEIPAFALLGVTCALVAIAFQLSLIASDQVSRWVQLPMWSKPALGGLAVGAIAIAFPDVLGVGYETTGQALKGAIPLVTLIALIVAKMVATAVTLGSRFGGGIFSPTLYLGALTGGAFGIVAASAFPDLASNSGLYAIIGMGAVAGAVLGAPISTTIIVFELTGGYALTLSLLFTVAISTGLTVALTGRSFFEWQLERRGLVLTGGPHRTLLRTIRVADFVERSDETKPVEADQPVLRTDDTLETALRRFDDSGAETLPVVEPTNTTIAIGGASQLHALRLYNKGLIDRSAEAHR
jgi:CIC family chloride channel protein